MIHNVFNKDLLIQCREPQFKRQHMDPAPPPDIINEEEKYEVEEIIGNEDVTCNFEYTGKDMETNMTSKFLKQDYHMSGK